MSDIAQAAGRGASAADLIARLEESARRTEVHCAGGRLVFRTWGEGRPLLLLHGGFGSWLHWVRNIGPLAEHCQVIAVDLPGLGDSDLLEGSPDGEAIATHIAEGLMSALPHSEPLTIAGFSLGGAIAAALARRVEPRLHHLLLLGPSGFGEMWQDATGELLRYSRDMSEDERRAVTRHNLARSMIADASHIDDLAITIQTMLVRDKPRLRGLTISRSEILLSNVAALRDPSKVTILWGEHDPYPAGGVRPGAVAVRKRLPGVAIEIYNDVGHWVAYEAPAAINTLLLSRVMQGVEVAQERSGP
jgi:pimeloyl-ACP methyl ester carboxylesterase